MQQEEYKPIYDAIIKGDWNDKEKFTGDEKWKRMSIPLGYHGHDLTVVMSIFSSFQSRAGEIASRLEIMYSKKERIVEKMSARALIQSAQTKIEDLEIKVNKDLVLAQAQGFEVTVTDKDGTIHTGILEHEKDELSMLKSEMNKWKKRADRMSSLLNTCSSKLKLDIQDMVTHKGQH